MEPWTTRYSLSCNRISPPSSMSISPRITGLARVPVTRSSALPVICAMLLAMAIVSSAVKSMLIEIRSCHDAATSGISPFRSRSSVNSCVLKSISL